MVANTMKNAKPEIQTGACVLGLGVQIRGITYELCQHSLLTERARDWERFILRFAERFKTRRVYVVHFTKERPFRINLYMRPYTFEDRRFAFLEARQTHGTVHIHDFKNLLQMPFKCVRCIRWHSPNSDVFEEYWKTMNECSLCHRHGSTRAGQFMGELVRICDECHHKLTKNITFNTITKRRPSNEHTQEWYRKVDESKDCADCIGNPSDLRPRPLQGRQDGSH